MIRKAKQLSKTLGLDLAIIYSIFGKIIQAGGGVISIVFILIYLDKGEQGYYYTFGSIVAIQIFFELGLGTVITQYVAHETVNLTLNKNIITGSIESISRLSSLLRMAVKWFSLVSLFLFFTLLFVGYVFFSNYSTTENINWKLPWTLLAISTSMLLMLNPLLSFIEGLGKVKEIALLRLIQQSVYTIILFLGLIGGFKLFSAGIALFFSFFTATSYFLWKFRALLKLIWDKVDVYKVNYRSEVFPYQWKIALSWVSGYFIFQLFNPVIFATEGPIAAGKMGMTLAVLNGITALSLTWINTKVPLFSTLIAKKEYNKLNIKFNIITRQMLLITFGMFFLLALIVIFLRTTQNSFSNRFIDTTSLIFLSLATIINIIINAMATYLRCHKKEPYLILSLIMGLLSAISTLTLGKYFGIKGITIGYFIVIGPICFTYATYVFLKKKQEWHYI